MADDGDGGSEERGDGGDKSRMRTILTAVAANLFIAAMKLVVAAVSGSAAMLAEGIHSIVDTGNAVLIAVGLRLAKRPADERFPFGRGKELFFWALIVAMSIFAVGGGVNIVEGISRIRHPHEVEVSWWTFAVLGASVVAEGISLVTAYRGLRRYQRVNLPRTRTIFQAVRAAKDPSVFSVLFEDSAAIAGLVVAFAGVLATTLLHDPLYDGLGSIGVGVILAVVAVVMGAECRSLLVGERALRTIVDGVRDVAAADAAVEAVVDVKTMQIGPDDVLLALRLRFRSRAAAADAVSRVSDAIRGKYHAVHGVLIDADSFAPRP